MSKDNTIFWEFGLVIVSLFGLMWVYDIGINDQPPQVITGVEPVCEIKLNSCNNNLQNLTIQYEIEKDKTQEYKLIISNMHQNYNNQDERFDKMLESYLEVRQQVQDANYQYALCYEGIYPHRKEFNP